MSVSAGRASADVGPVEAAAQSGLSVVMKAMDYKLEESHKDMNRVRRCK